MLKILITLLMVCFSFGAFADEYDRSFGDYVLNGLEAGIAVEQLAIEVILRARDIKRALTGEEPLAPAEEWKHDTSDGKRKGPPDWAPAHGWRSKMGQKESTDLGAFTQRKIDEGLSGKTLVTALRVEVERLIKVADATVSISVDSGKGASKGKGAGKSKGKGKK